MSSLDFDPEQDLPELPPGAFGKADTGSDLLFYGTPRLVTHIDDGAVAAVTALYREVLPPGGAILDLMSSWVSHLPPEVSYGSVRATGMNAAELEANPRLTSFRVQDLNREPVLGLEDASVDACTICVSVQYLERPVAVLREVARVLRPGGPVAVTFSNRCFPTKAVAIWSALDGPGQCRLVALYMERAGFERIEQRTLAPPGRRADPLWAVIGRAPAGRARPPCGTGLAPGPATPHMEERGGVAVSLEVHRDEQA